MLFTEERFEAFAKQAGQMTQAGETWIDVDSVGAALGLTSHESNVLANHLKAEGWVDLQSTQYDVKLRVTLKGFREIAKLRMPRWRRWLARHPAIVVAIASALVMGVFKLLELWLFPR
jgi:hypothetical protein